MRGSRQTGAKLSGFETASEDRVIGGRFTIDDTNRLEWIGNSDNASPVVLAVLEVIEEGDEVVAEIAEAIKAPSSAPWLNNFILNALTNESNPDATALYHFKRALENDVS